MTRKPKPSPKSKKNAAEYQRFRETAKAAEASDDAKDFDRAFTKIVPRQTKPAK